MSLYNDPENEWARIENEGQPRPKKKKKIVWENCLQEKYAELTERYGREYPSGAVRNDVDCERLLDDLYAFERVFRVMKWNKKPMYGKE